MRLRNIFVEVQNRWKNKINEKATMKIKMSPSNHGGIGVKKDYERIRNETVDEKERKTFNN